MMVLDEAVDPPFIGDWYREKKLGSGSFGLVTLWKNKKTGESIAIKKCHILKDTNASTDKLRERWENEVKLMSDTINCDNIVKTIKVKPASFLDQLMKTNQSGLPLLIMEYCEGGDLRTMLNKRTNCCGLKESDVRSILKSLRNAVAYLHDMGITHRDIKPENIVLKKHDNETVYKLTDLGYARALDIQSLNASIVGTVEYLAPELIQDAKYNNSVDYWSLGVIAFEIACGLRPFIPHAPIVQWILALKKKNSKQLCIAEENNGAYSFHETIYPETRICSRFKENLEKWLCLALEMNPKQRGFVFEFPKLENQAKSEQSSGRPKSVTFAETTEMKPNKILKIFSLLDEIMDEKILTIFSLYTYQFLSFPIDNTTTMLQLYQMISERTKIPVDDIDFILTLDQEIEKIDESTMPLQLYIENNFDKPMVYVIKKPCDKKLMTVLKEEVHPNIPRTIKTLFDIRTGDAIKPHILKQFLINCYYFIQNEKLLYETLIDGIQNYVLCLNHEISIYKPTVTKMNQLVLSLPGFSEMFSNSLNTIRENLDKMEIDNWCEAQNQLLDQYNKLNTSISKLNEATSKVIQRYESVLRRSKDLTKDKIMTDSNMSAAYNMNELENLYQDLLIQIIDKKIHEKSHHKMLKFIYMALKERDALLRDEELSKIQCSLSTIAIEQNEIRKCVVNILPQAERYKNEMFKLNSDLLLNYHNLIQSNAIITRTKEDLEQDADNQKNRRKIEFQIGAAIRNMSGSNIKPNDLLCFGEGPDLISLLNDGSSIINSMDDLIEDGMKSLRGATITQLQY